MLNRLFFVLVCTISVLVATGCGGAGSKAAVTQLQFTSPTSGPVIDQGQSFQVSVQGASGNVTWSLQPAYKTPVGTPIGSLSNESNTSATYTACSGPNCLPGQQLTIVATAGTQSSSLAVTVNALPTAAAPSSVPTTGCPPSGVVPNQDTVPVNSFYTTQPFTVSNGTAPFTGSVASGALPIGLNVAPTNPASNDTTVQGTPSQSGCSGSGVRLQVTDATGATATTPAVYFGVVPPPLALKLPNYENGFGGDSYKPTAMIVGGGTPPYTWCIQSNSIIPPGLTTSPATPNTVNGNQCSAPQTSPLLVVSGLMNAADDLNSYSPGISVSDSQSPYPASGDTSLTMNPVAPTNCDPSAVSNPVAYLQAGVPHPFQVRGFDANGPVVIEGSFITQNVQNGGGYQGTITGGEEDIIRTSGSQAGLTITSGSYFNSGNHGCLSLTNSAGTTNTFELTLSGCSLGAQSANCSTITQPSDATTVCGQQSVAGQNTYYLCLPAGRLVEFDNTDGSGTTATGILRSTNSSFSSEPSGIYAFGLSGWDASGGRFGAAGSFNASSSALSAVAADVNDAGAIQSNLTGGSGTFSAVDPNGRATVTVSAGSESLNLVAYVVSSNEIMLSTTGTPGVANPTVSGEAIGTAGPFGVSSLQSTQMFHTAGVGSSGEPDVSVGVFTFDGIGDVGGTLYEDQAGTFSTTSVSGNYQVDSATGRIVFSAPQNTQNLGAHPLVGYIAPSASSLTRSACINPANCITGFLVDIADSSAQSGILEFQTPLNGPPPPFYNSYVAGFYSYASDEILNHSTPGLEGYAIARPSTTSTTSGKLYLTQDLSSATPTYCQYGSLSESCTLLISGDQFNPGSSYTVSSTGTGSIDGESVSVTNGNVIFYIDESPLNLNPAIVVAEQ